MIINKAAAPICASTTPYLYHPTVMFSKFFARNALFSPPPQGTPVSRYILWLIGFFAFLNVYSIQSVLPLVQTAFHTTKATTGLLVGITLFAVAILSPFIGLISDRLGRKNIICLSLISLTIPTALTPFCENLNLLLLLRFVQGLSIPGIIVVTMAYIGEEVAPMHIARATASYVSGTIMGGFAGRFITGHMAELGKGWYAGFHVLAVLLIVGVFLVFRFLPPSRNFLPSANMRQGLHTLAGHFKNPRLLAACAVGFCVLLSLASGFTYIGYLLQFEPFNLSSAAVANIFIVYLVGVMVTPFSSHLVSRLGNRLTLISALSLSALGLCLTLIPSLVWIIIGLTVFSSGMFICQAASVGFIAMNIKQGRSLATGLYNMSYYCGGAFGSWVSGLANDVYHWPGTVVTIIITQFIAAMIAFFFWKPLPESTKPLPENAP